MLKKFKADGWKIIEEGLDLSTNRLSESIFSLGNGHMGLRGFFEEAFSGDSLTGIYLAGIYYPDRTRVGWWKNGYPEFFAKVLNSPNWAGADIEICGEALDLAQCKVSDFRRELDMREGRLTRSFVAENGSGKKTRFVFTKFLSMAKPNIACISINAKPLNYEGDISFLQYVDGDVSNEDSNYDEKFWVEINRSTSKNIPLLTMETKKTCFSVSCAFDAKVYLDAREIAVKKELISKDKYVGSRYSVNVPMGSEAETQKFVAVCTSRDFEKDALEAEALEKLKSAIAAGWPVLYEEHCRVMAKKWEECDVVIEGDVEAQQGVRYNIFQLNQTYTGTDPRLNIGPKGFTGEKYGGSTYWDTEAFCLPFYLYTNEKVARNLLYYRYLHLERAKENAAKLGFKGALYPMVTMDGQECHNEWEITFEEIHRNGAIAYAIYNYTHFTGDESYLFEYGLEVLTEISRFWADRVNFNPRKGKYMILGVTGPNEYENNVNNNWYTNTMAAWTLRYTLESLEKLKAADPLKYAGLSAKLKLLEAELFKWKDINEKMYYPYVEDLAIFEQNDLYMDKEQVYVSELPKEALPLNKHWSWDRILRSCFIKQADVVQGLYFFPDNYDIETKKRNFDFYEARTVHESSLSASIHSIVASQIGYREKAYELYLRTARLDLDNYNDDTDDGVHLTSMAGSWLAVVEGFAGVKVRDGILQLAPYLPGKWRGFSFKISFRERSLKVSAGIGKAEVELLNGEPMSIAIFDKIYEITAGVKLSIEMTKEA